MTDVTLLEGIVLGGDLSKLSSSERLVYYKSVCESLGLNPLTRPLEYIVLNGKLTLYARKDATDQLRQSRGVSITRLEREVVESVYVVTAYARDKVGREDSSIGAVGIGGLKGDALANAMMKAECVPLDSEILTRAGWRTHDRLEVGEEVLAYDCSTDQCKWTALLDVTVHESLPMIRLFSDKGQFEVLCTPDHSWAVRKQPYELTTRTDGSRGPRGPYRNRKPDRMLVKAEAINSSHGIVLAAAEAGTRESVLSPAEAAILGWAVTDGTIQERGSFRRVGICQSKEENFQTIRDLVGVGVREVVSPARARTFPSSGRTYECKEQHWWYLPAQASRELLEKAGFESRADLPSLTTRLDSPARQAMIQAYMLAEGDKRLIFANTDRHILDSFQILCALEGIATGTEHVKEGTCRTIRRKLTRHVAGSFLNRESAGDMPAWCPTTELGTWVMRQRGRVMITGNTKAKRRVTLSICGLGMLDETEIGTVPDAKPVPVDIETGEIVTPTPAPTRQVSASTQPQAPASPPAAISPVQVTALALALREAGFKNDEAGKLEGRDFLAFMAGLPALDSVKDLSREQAALLLDLLGSSEHDEQGQPVKGSYRADRAKLSAAVQKWADSKASAEFDDAAAAAVLGIDEVMSPAELKLYRAAADLE